MKQIIDGIQTWRVFQGDKGYFFNGWILNLPEGQLVVDPPALSEEVVKAILAFKNPLGILLTNWSHKRATADILAIRKMPVLIHEKDAPKLENLKSDRFVDEFTQVSSILKVIPAPGRSPGEIALLLNIGKGVLILGDVLIGHPALGLAYLPDAKIENKTQLQETVQNLTKLDFDSLLLGDGDSILKGAKLEVIRFVKDPVTMPAPGVMAVTVPKGC